MTDDLRYKISDELLSAICSLQDAYMYVQYAEQLALGHGGYGGDLRIRIRISALRRQINNTVNHAAIIRDSVRA